jgi:hypothetical protein
MSLLFGNPTNTVINTVAILRLDNIYGLPTCLVINVISYMHVFVCVFRIYIYIYIYIFVSMSFKPTSTHMWQTYLSTMVARVDLIVFFMCFLHLSNNLVEADWGLSLKEELKFKKRLINLKKFAIKSIQVRFLEAILLILLF